MPEGSHPSACGTTRSSSPSTATGRPTPRSTSPPSTRPTSGRGAKGTSSCVALLPALLHVEADGELVTFEAPGAPAGSRIAVSAGNPSYAESRFVRDGEAHDRPARALRLPGGEVRRPALRPARRDPRRARRPPAAGLSAAGHAGRTDGAGRKGPGRHGRDPGRPVRLQDGRQPRRRQPDHPVPGHDQAAARSRCAASSWTGRRSPTTPSRPSSTRPAYAPADRSNFLKHWADGKPPAGEGDHPVRWVSLDDARAYAKWAGKRLPTEAEWQYAAQGRDGRPFPWGPMMGPGRCNDKLNRTTPVTAFPKGASPFGVLDMVGNVWQMTGRRLRQRRLPLRDHPGRQLLRARDERMVRQERAAGRRPGPDPAAHRAGPRPGGHGRLPLRQGRRLSLPAA